MRTLIRTFAIAALLGSAGIARAADLDGGSLSTWWALPWWLKMASRLRRLS